MGIAKDGREMREVEGLRLGQREVSEVLIYLPGDHENREESSTIQYSLSSRSKEPANHRRGLLVSGTICIQITRKQVKRPGAPRRAKSVVDRL